MSLHTTASRMTAKGRTTALPSDTPMVYVFCSSVKLMAVMGFGCFAHQPGQTHADEARRDSDPPVTAGFETPRTVTLC
jgi:hypothetical protein